DGLWIGYVTLPNDPVTGKRRRKVVSAKTQAAANAKLRKLRAELDKAGDLPTSSPTLERWLATWLDRIAAPRLKPRTLATYRGYIEQYIVPTIGRHRLERLTPDHVRQLHHAITGRGLSSTTALQAHRILVVALRDAMREGKVTRNVATLVDAPSKAVASRGALTAEDARALLLSVAQDEQAAVRWGLALMAGLRQGEALGLTRDAVDLDAGVITVEWQLQRLPRGTTIPAGQEAERVHGGLWLTRPKSRAGWREVPIAPPLAEMLRRYLAYRPVGMGGLILYRDGGRPLDPSDDSRAWHAALKAAGLPRVPLHSARHTTATLLYELGVAERTRVAILGHSSATVTAGYTHVSDREAADAMGRLGMLLLPTRS
ncbi:MAG TPA: tyrosine-type recombinase/integrase, partial [Jiangellaceae bacterium]|nr:tyrosine-type recombinase/integrase [Jiangellaceae bacterium]